jgi:hypothetical protein
MTASAALLSRLRTLAQGEAGRELAEVALEMADEYERAIAWNLGNESIIHESRKILEELRRP